MRGAPSYFCSPTDDDPVTLVETMDGTQGLLLELIQTGSAIRRAGKKYRLRNADQSFNPKYYQGFRQHMVQILAGLPSVIESSRGPPSGEGWIDAKLDFTKDRLS